MAMAKMRRGRSSWVIADEWRSCGRLVVRGTTAVLFGLLLSGIAVRSTVAEVFQVSRPAVAVGWQPRHAEASARVAHRLVAANHVDEGVALARHALARSPLLPRGYAALGLATESAGDPAQAM